MAGIKYQLMRDSPRLWAVVKHRLNQLNPNHKWAPFEIAIGLPRHKLERYYNTGRGLTEFHLMKLCQFLGIYVGLDIQVQEFPSEQCMQVLTQKKKTKDESVFI